MRGGKTWNHSRTDRQLDSFWSAQLARSSFDSIRLLGCPPDFPPVRSFPSRPVPDRKPALNEPSAAFLAHSLRTAAACRRLQRYSESERQEERVYRATRFFSLLSLSAAPSLSLSLTPSASLILERCEDHFTPRRSWRSSRCSPSSGRRARQHSSSSQTTYVRRSCAQQLWLPSHRVPSDNLSSFSLRCHPVFQTPGMSPTAARAGQSRSTGSTYATTGQRDSMPVYVQPAPPLDALPSTDSTKQAEP